MTPPPNLPAGERKFPLQAQDCYRDTIKIPWKFAEEAYKEYSARYGTSQSLERLAERGGFGAEEIVMILCWRIERLENQLQSRK